MKYTSGGSAAADKDYIAPSGVKKMKPGKRSVHIKVRPSGDGPGPGVKRTVNGVELTRNAFGGGGGGLGAPSG